LDRDEKLRIIKEFKTFVNPTLSLQKIKPNEHGDWISMRNESFDNFISLSPVKKLTLSSNSFFIINSIGIITNRDSWVYNFSKKELISNVTKMIDQYNSDVENIIEIRKQGNNSKVEDLITKDETKIKWVQNLVKDAEKGIKHLFDNDCIRVVSYRPFTKEYLYFNSSFNWSRSLTPKFFPNNNLQNLIICLTGITQQKEFSVLIIDCIPDVQVIQNTQCFPLYFYEETNSIQKGMFDIDESQKYIRRDAISDFILERAKKQYGKNVTKEDIFYYVYGFLHNTEYRETFANDLKKMLPRLPLVEEVKDFWAFSKAGRKLAELHLNYETVEAYKEATVTGDDGKSYLIDKMRFPKKDQKDTIIYNSKISISNIPPQAYEYVVNGKSAIEWIMERYQVTTHKESGITNNPNDWAAEVGNPRYILDLLLSIINVSVQTVDIVKALPKFSA
jgi:predicted helicase